jgi:hypothetical protein
MIIEAIKYKVVFKRYVDAQLEPSPTDDEWSNVEAISKFLELLKKTLKYSQQIGVPHLTSSWKFCFAFIMH